jgi:hypothetical protein
MHCGLIGLGNNSNILGSSWSGVTLSLRRGVDFLSSCGRVSRKNNNGYRPFTHNITFRGRWSGL